MVRLAGQDRTIFFPNEQQIGYSSIESINLHNGLRPENYP